MLLNGIFVEMEVYDVYIFFDFMKLEVRLMEGLFLLGFKVSFLKLNFVFKQLQVDLKFRLWYLYINK